jgi:hypothetical protein
MRLAFRPVSPDTALDPAAGSGLRWLARFDAAGLLTRPFEPGVGLDIAEERDGRGSERRLRLGLARALAEAAGDALPCRVPRRIAALPVEAVADALREVAATEPLARTRLPAFGLLLPARGEPRPCERAVRLTVAVLARRRGCVFLRDAEPLAPSDYDGPALDLWTPQACLP